MTPNPLALAAAWGCPGSMDRSLRRHKAPMAAGSPAALLIERWAVGSPSPRSASACSMPTWPTSHYRGISPSSPNIRRLWPTSSGWPRPARPPARGPSDPATTRLSPACWPGPGGCWEADDPGAEPVGTSGGTDYLLPPARGSGPPLFFPDLWIPLLRKPQARLVRQNCFHHPQPPSFAGGPRVFSASASTGSESFRPSAASCSAWLPCCLPMTTSPSSATSSTSSSSGESFASLPRWRQLLS